MARLPRYECDRCGARYDKNHAKDVYGRWEQNLIGVSLVNTDGQLMRFDLCDHCLGRLQTWLNDGGGEDPYAESTDEASSDE